MDKYTTTAYLLENPNAGLTEKNEKIEDFINYYQKKGVCIKRLSSNEFSTPESFHKLCKENDVSILITNGGDGTINFVLPYLMNSGIKLLPLQGGTFNHFAKHIGIPPLLNDSLKLLLTGKEKRIDLGEVNNRLFINFSTIGFYAEIIHTRTKLQKKSIPKWIAFVISLVTTLKNYRYKKVSFSLRSDDTIRTPLLFVGNNIFHFGSVDLLRRRESFTENVLHIGILKDMSKFQLALFILRAMTVDVKKYLEFQDFGIKSLVVNSSGKRVTVTLDGESISLETPLTFKSISQAISVIIPP